MSQLLNGLPDNYFSKLFGQKLEVGNKPLINMAIGIPDQPTPNVILEELKCALDDPLNLQYSTFRGKEAFIKAICAFYKRTYNVTLNPDTEVCILYGTKNGLVHLPLCVIEPGEGVMLPNPGYSDYLPGVLLAQGKAYDLTLKEENGYLPDFDEVDEAEWENTSLVYLNYPSNPTGAVATKSFFDDTVERFKGTNKRIVHDFAYAFLGYDEPHPSILQSEGAKDVAIEIYSMSKGFSMSGFRVGFAVGNKEMIQNLTEYQNYTQAGMFGAVQDAATKALNESEELLKAQYHLFKKRRDYLVDALSKTKYTFSPLAGGMFLWIKVPVGFTGETFSAYLLEQQSILVTPGIPFGSEGQDYVRASLAVPESQLESFVERLLEEEGLYDK